VTVREAGRRVLTPMALVVAAVFMTDVVFAVDSVPAVYGITDDPLSLAVILLMLAGATGTSLLANRRDQRRADVVTKEKANVR
jgi:tellurite resistance protein TerC